MSKLTSKLITFIIILTLFIPRGFAVLDLYSVAYAQSETTVTPSETTSEDTATSNTSSEPTPTSQQTYEPKPTSAPQPTSAATLSTAPQPSSGPSPTLTPEASSQEPQPTSDTSTTGNPSSTGQASTDNNNSSSSNSVSTPTPTRSPYKPTPSGWVRPTATEQNTINSGDSSNTESSTESIPYANDGFSSLTSSGSVNDPANVATGAYSENTATETNNQTTEVTNTNTADVQNKIDVITGTGFNSADFNTMPGSVFTGDAQAVVNLLNKLNSNITGIGGFSVFNIYDTHVGDIVFQLGSGNSLNGGFESASANVSKNSVTGAASTNLADSNNNFIVKEANGNDAKLVNNIELQAVTGENTASYNTLGGNINTGDAFALGNIINLVNTNIRVTEWVFGIVNIFGTLAGNIILPADNGSSNNQNSSPSVLVENSQTGALSDNQANYENNEIASFTNTNTADVANILQVEANTGGNDASFNTGPGSIVTGNADVNVSDTTVANTNAVAEEGTVWIVIVNEMGRWVGHILGLPDETNYASNYLPLSNNSSDSPSVLVENSATGALSDNTSSFASTSQQEVNNQNSAKIENNIDVLADTGNNSSSFNTAGGEIKTGDAQAGLNLLNMVNTNVVAKKFAVILVNVLGTFLGDVVPPGQTPEENDYSGYLGNNNQSNSNNGSTDNQPQLPSFSEIGQNVGGVVSTDSIEQYQQEQQEQRDDDQDQASVGQDESGDSQPQILGTTYNKPSSGKRDRRLSRRAVTGLNSTVSPTNGSNQVGKIKRGIFLSPAFAKATETSFAGMLFGGANFRVTKVWLGAVPLALMIYLLRRRKKFNINIVKYLNAILEIIL